MMALEGHGRSLGILFQILAMILVLASLQSAKKETVSARNEAAAQIFELQNVEPRT